MNPPKDHASAGDDGLEELENDAIVAQETAAHTPQRRANVKVVEPSVVIADQGGHRGRRRGSNEQTLVIRDRRAVDEVRRKIAEEQKRRERARRMRTIALLALGGLAAFGLGSFIAWYSGDEPTQAAPSAQPSAAVTAPAPVISATAPASQPSPQILDLDEATTTSATSAAPPHGSDQTVDLQQLPLEKSTRPAPRPPPHPRNSPVTDQVPF